MSVIATFTVPAADFTLGQTISSNPGIRVRLDRVIPAGDNFIPYFWASDDSVGHIRAELSGETDIESFTIVDETNGEALVRVEWAELTDGLLEALMATEASILEGVGEEDAWRLQLRFDDHDRLSEFFGRCAEKGISLDLEMVHNPDIYQSLEIQAQLTEAQREALDAALEAGYFQVPRGTNLVELADQLDISDSAASQRLRRGIRTVLGDYAMDPDTDSRVE